MLREDPLSTVAPFSEARSARPRFLPSAAAAAALGTVNASEYFISPVVNQSADCSTGMPASRVPSSVETDHAEP